MYQSDARKNRTNQSSFNRIDSLLDQSLDDIEKMFNQRFQQQQESRNYQQHNSLPELLIPNINNKQFNNQLIPQIASLIKVYIQNQVKKKEEGLNQEFINQCNLIQQKENIQKQSLEEIIKFKENQLQFQQQQINQILNQQISPQLIFKPFNYQFYIEVFEFKQEVLKQTQLLREHQDDVNTLKFMNKSNRFISGSVDQLIIIWSINESHQWICQQKLDGNNGIIFCLVLNYNEDMIISGSSDSTIKFWMKQNQWLCQQTIKDHTNDVYGLSLNQQQHKVISCGFDNQILIIEQSQYYSIWIVIEKIEVETHGIRICFINDNLFTFQPYGIEQMHVYEINNTNRQYSKIKDIIVKGEYDQVFFPQQYIKQKCLLVNEQLVEFGDLYIFGCMSDDGQYLITWDSSSNEIQIRKYNEI
ncbi:unnamed protein product [Paramecium pentaurelia]|uniref:WD40-repeat-containing domain n=1 Tax=Paramecium pentaurelia TaxID=43138 RepID=A0A8S1YCF4_9CILI|nr:unnamed protein product [Paramecium pentaurelia]